MGEFVRGNPPATGGSVTALVVGLLAAFTDLSADQMAAVGAVVAFVAGIVAQRWTTPVSV